MKAKQSSAELEKAREHSGRPLSHAEIAAALAPLGIDRTAVYRNLVALSDARLISRVNLGDPGSSNGAAKLMRILTNTRISYARNAAK